MSRLLLRPNAAFDTAARVLAVLQAGATSPEAFFSAKY